MSQTRQTSGLTTSTSHYTSSRSSNSPSIKALQLEYAKLQKEPVEGFTVKLDDDSNLYKWHGKQKKSYKKNFPYHNFLFLLVGIFGPPDTLYEGGYFKADMEFPTTYPFAPPKVNKIYVNPFK
jgi:ubiquitin-conjugating enzyme E2 R